MKLWQETWRSFSQMSWKTWLPRTTLKKPQMEPDSPGEWAAFAVTRLSGTQRLTGLTFAESRFCFEPVCWDRFWTCQWWWRLHKMSARYSQVIHFVGIAVLPVKASQHSMCQHLLIVSEPMATSFMLRLNLHCQLCITFACQWSILRCFFVKTTLIITKIIIVLNHPSVACCQLS